MHKTNETRNRLRIRLNQRNAKSNKTLKAPKLTTILPQNKTETSVPISSKIQTTNQQNSLPQTPDPTSDISGLLNFIEGNNEKVPIAEKKAAKKARQKSKKEQERLKFEAEERKKAEEEAKKLKERLRLENLARQQEEKAKCIY